MSTIRELLKLAKTDGTVGIEVEIEGDGLDFQGDDCWRREVDHSLKSDEAGEFVLRKPLDKLKAYSSVIGLYKNLEGSVVHDSMRAGVHVHYNVQELTTTQLATSLTTYYLLEKVLTSFCGEGRIGNLFCLRLVDAELPLFKLIEAYRRKELGILHTDDIRYAACNLKALGQYGSIEFRAMKTPKTPHRINNWVSIICKVMESYLLFDNPMEVMAAVSSMGESGFLEHIVGRDLYKELGGLWCSSEIRDMVDIVQVFAFSRSWEEVKAAPTLNIFGTQPEEDW